MDRKQVRIFSIPGLLVLGVLVTGPAPAQPTVVDDGCGELRDVIVAQSSGALVPVDQPSLLRASPGKPVAPDPPQYCMDTAAAATAAFSSAMHAAGVAMSWGSAGAEEYCDSRSLSHCYPRLLNGDRATAGQLHFVQDAWSAVVAGITASCPTAWPATWPYSSGMHCDGRLADACTRILKPSTGLIPVAIWNEAGTPLSTTSNSSRL
jgi:hypothetical protein